MTCPLTAHGPSITWILHRVVSENYNILQILVAKKGKNLPFSKIFECLSGKTVPQIHSCAVRFLCKLSSLLIASKHVNWQLIGVSPSPGGSDSILPRKPSARLAVLIHTKTARADTALPYRYLHSMSRGAEVLREGGKNGLFQPQNERHIRVAINKC